MNFSMRTWLALSILSISCIPIAIHFFPIAFPVLSLNITMNRTQALDQARTFSQKHQLLPALFNQAAVFHLDNDAKTFIELDGGGKDALTRIMQEDLYMPYTWTVRHFHEGDPRTTLIRFKPDGTLYGFQQQLSENDDGENVSSDYARVIAETPARDAWHIDFNAYHLIETAQETQPSGRIDHTFVYERTNQTIGSGGTYRLRLGVSGDQFSMLSHDLHIPETFTRRYAEMRSANETIADAAEFWYKLFYFLGGCILGVLWLGRKRWLIIRAPFLWALGIALLLALTKLNELPIVWISYDTALPAQDFLFSYLITILNSFVHTIIPLALIFIAAESLSRKAFGNQPQLWRVWHNAHAATSVIAGSTIAAYLLVAFDFAFVSLFYAFTITYYQWWVPSCQFFDPNILATYVPWLEPCVEALYAGFREECLFRAIPLAGAALLGDRLGKRTLFISIAFIIQAIVFSAAHANYPGHPAYARLVELLFPSCVYGFIYLRYGLLPVVVSHVVYDIIWMAIPLFISHAPGAWVNQSITILIALIPLIIILAAYIRTRVWHILAPAAYNFAWQPTAPPAILPMPTTYQATPKSLSLLSYNGLLLAGVVGIPLWLYTVHFNNDALALRTTRNQALLHAKEYAHAHGMTGDHWYPIVALCNEDDHKDQDHRFVWQHTNPKDYQQLLSTYLTPPRWIVRFINFDQDLVKRTEEFCVGIQDTGIHGFRHIFPETDPGSSLSVDDARIRVHEVIAQETTISPQALQAIEASPLKQPARTDWHFIYADPLHSMLSHGQGRMLINLAGNAFSRLSWRLHIPEVWERADRGFQNKVDIIQLLCSLLLYFLTLCAAYAIAYTRRFTFNIPVWRALFIFLLILNAIMLIISLPSLLLEITTSEPFYNQLFALLSTHCTQLLLQSAALSIMMLAMTTIQYRYTLKHMHDRTICAIALGSFIAGLLACIERLKPSLAPYWAHYNALNSLTPTTATFIHALLELFIFSTALGVLYALIDYLTNTGNRNIFIGNLCMILFGLCVIAREPLHDINYWLFAGTALGIIIIAAYYLLLRFDRALIPLVVLPIIVAESIQQATLNAFTESIPAHLLAAAYCIIAAYMWTYAFDLDSETSQK